MKRCNVQILWAAAAGEQVWPLAVSGKVFWQRRAPVRPDRQTPERYNLDLFNAKAQRGEKRMLPLCGLASLPWR